MNAPWVAAEPRRGLRSADTALSSTASACDADGGGAAPRWRRRSIPPADRPPDLSASSLYPRACSPVLDERRARRNLSPPSRYGRRGGWQPAAVLCGEDDARRVNEVELKRLRPRGASPRRPSSSLSATTPTAGSRPDARSPCPAISATRYDALREAGRCRDVEATTTGSMCSSSAAPGRDPRRSSQRSSPASSRVRSA